MKNFKNLEVGCYYLDGNGFIHGPITVAKDEMLMSNYQFRAGNEIFTMTGTYERGSSTKDLVTKVNVVITPCETKNDIKLFVGAIVELSNGSVGLITCVFEGNLYVGLGYSFYEDGTTDGGHHANRVVKILNKKEY